MLEILSDWPTAAQAASAVVTAIATVVLGYATWVLAKETRVLSRASSHAHVTATVEPNQWAINFVDIIVANSGNAVAYDVNIEFDPPLPNGFDNDPPDKNAPLQKISVLRPGQSILSMLAEFSSVQGKTYSVTLRWRGWPNAKQTEKLSYQLSMADYEGLRRTRTPLIQIADEVKKIREDWQWVLGGSRHLHVDTFSSEDREKARATWEARRAEARADDKKEPEGEEKK